MSSTILEIFGSEEVTGGGGGVWCDVASVAVASHRKGGKTLARREKNVVAPERERERRGEAQRLAIILN